MQLSAEVRWFWPAAVAGLEDWFRSVEAHGSGPGGGATRTDEYLRAPGQRELGIKKRGGKPGVEVKGLVAVRDHVAVAPFAGPIELWTKWTADALDLGAAALVSTAKQRWLRKFDTAAPQPRELALGDDERPLVGPPPAVGCNVELTEATLDGGERWWTLGFEAFGTLATVEDSVRAVAAVLASRRPPPLPDGLCAGYPAWLADHA